MSWTLSSASTVMVSMTNWTRSWSYPFPPTSTGVDIHLDMRGNGHATVKVAVHRDITQSPFACWQFTFRLSNSRMSGSWWWWWCRFVNILRRERARSLHYMSASGHSNLFFNLPNQLPVACPQLFFFFFSHPFRLIKTNSLSSPIPCLSRGIVALSSPQQIEETSVVIRRLFAFDFFID